MEQMLDLGSHTLEQLALAMERNMVGHMSWATEQLPGASVIRSDGLTAVYSGFVTDTFNVVCGAMLDETSADAAIAEAIRFFASEGARFSWWVGPASTPLDLGTRLETHGLTHAEDETGMIVDLALLANDVPTVDGIEIVHASDPAQVRDLGTVVAANWNPPDQEVVMYYQRAAPILLAPGSPFRMWVAYADAEPVAACEVYLGEGVAGLYAVVTREGYRRRGIGTAVTRTALLGARREGYRVATLQASAEGQRVYERLGFLVNGMFREYKPMMTGAGSLVE